MSILVVYVTPEGLLFGADRNITTQITRQGGGMNLTVQGQSQRPKITKWNWPWWTRKVKLALAGWPTKPRLAIPPVPGRQAI